MDNTLKELRIEKGMTQADVAEKAGITQQAYCSIESGKNKPSIDVAMRLSKIFRKPVNKIFLI